ncbi:FAD-dependent oxidoreductase [Desulfofundulus thermosubterraneus]|uniref:FAD dependent oxidoreductase n=1 Tax=Desulfofundulus thermosubterraneus DSM 16057 TaxID=1121432 RepID=A0A1M6I1D3_9FIRM|nr:FAD-dependent oxidoreductase [Desulfofundulus thermosubterraneus]SHJ28210.1 FAD dependent oxidoreductase [Desulfofundulus thermosubterraneus DSM 16057]
MNNKTWLLHENGYRLWHFAGDRFFAFLLPILFLLSLFLLAARHDTGVTGRVEQYDIVIYGGSFAGCAAARIAALAAPHKSILLVVPDPVPALGSTGTTGGQNFFDIWHCRGQLVAEGSFARWYGQSGQFYHPGTMATLLRADLAAHDNISILWCHDIEAVDYTGYPRRIARLVLREVFPDRNGVTRWGSGVRRVRGRVFVDASDDGRLTRLAGVTVTSGRFDWPAEYLDESERGLPGTATAGPARQQAATLMFKVRGVKVPPPEAGRVLRVGDLTFIRDPRGGLGIAGGSRTFRENPVVRAFNERHAPRGFALKPLNAASDGRDSSQWWVNALVVFNVDGRACLRDRGTARYPAVREDYLDVDTARLKAREMLKSPDFMEALRQFSAVNPITGQRYGFAGAELVRDSRGEPVVGDILYLRETIHLPLDAERVGHGTENTNYALTARACQGAGNGSGRADTRNRTGKTGAGKISTNHSRMPSPAADAANYPTRIGLGYYAMDINAYTYRDLKQNGAYTWPVTGTVRPDWKQQGGEPQNPVYLPYRMLVTPQVENLLVPGYATGASSLAWAEIRVIPNLCVLGDAAGAAAARAVLYGEAPARFGPAQISWVQQTLRRLGARLEK